MKISTKGRYGVRIMLDLALHTSQTSVSLNDISKRQEISQKYLWNIINALKAGGLVVARRGSKGGYALARTPAQITIFDIIILLEGAPTLVPCNDSPDKCQRAADCVVRDMWRDLSLAIAANLKAITLDDLMRKQQSVQDKESANYTI